MGTPVDELNAKDRDLLERYLAGQLDDTEVREVRERAKREQQFGQAFRSLHSTLGQNKPPEGQDEENAQEDYGEAREALPQAFPYRLAAVAVVVLLFLMPLYLYWRSTNKSGDSLFATYFEAYPVKSRLLEDASPAQKNGLEAYRMENYELSIGKFQQYLVQNPQDYPYRLYLCIALLDEEMTSQAIQNLQDIRVNAAEPWRSEATWYLSLAHLQAGNRKKSQEVLIEIIKKGGKHQGQAQALLNNL